MPIYKFKTGDTLPKVAKLFGITPSGILQSNQGLISPTPGTTVRIPSNSLGARYNPAVPNIGGTLGSASFNRNTGIVPTSVTYRIPTPAGLVVNVGGVGQSNITGVHAGKPVQPAQPTPVMPTGSFVSGAGTVNLQPVPQAANPPQGGNGGGGFPGYWGGGKNGQFYRTLREARIASRRHRQAKGEGVTTTTTDNKSVATNSNDYSLTWRVG